MKTKYELEYTFNTSPNFLYTRLSTPEGLSEWFADNVNSRGKKFTFIWDDTEEVAERVSQKNNVFVKFKWEEDEDADTYFELRIQVDDLTKDVSLLVVDFSPKPFA